LLRKRCSRSCIERTGDDVRGERRRGGVVADVGSVVTGVGGVEAEGRCVFDDGDGDVGEGRDATAAYEGRTGESGRE
jgi:hypothetical protein